MHFRSSTYESDPELKSIDLFGEVIAYKRSELGTGAGPDRSAELSKLHDQITTAIRDQAATIRNQAEELVGAISELSKRDSYRLALLRCGSVTLAGC